VIAIAVYGGAGVANYSRYEPDYSLIIACIALGFDLLSLVFFVIEIFYFQKVMKEHPPNVKK
jgi:hypothetical protein